MRLGHWILLALGIATAACASTIGPVVPSVQVLVVLDSLDDTLRVIPVDSPNVVHKVLLKIAALDKHAMALRGPFVAIGSGGSREGTSGAISYFRLASPAGLVCSGSPVNHGPIAALTIDDNGRVFAAIPLSNGVPHIDPTAALPCAPGGGFVRGGPSAFVNARSTLFIVTGAGTPCPPAQMVCTETASWLATSTGELDDGKPLTDSILLSLPGNAQGAVLASDGNLYVINAGNGRQPDARLSQVDPVGRTEHNVYNGFGTLPQYIATDGERVFVASALEGLMVFNSRTGSVERDYHNAIPLLGAPRGLTADDVGRVYALIAGSCTLSGAAGKVQVFGADLVNNPTIQAGHCPVAIGVTDIPSTLYHFDLEH
jgi:hypothetical protein